MKASCYSCLRSFFCCGCLKQPKGEPSESLIVNDDITPIQKNKQLLYCYGKVPAALSQPVELSKYSLYPIKKIACGSNHCIILFEDNKIGVFGSNENGQLGLDINQDNPIIDDLFIHQFNINESTKYRIWDIAAGNDFSLLLIGVGHTTTLVKYGGSKNNEEGKIFNDAMSLSSIGFSSFIGANYIDNFNKSITNIASVYAFEERIILITGGNQVYIGGIDFDNIKLNNDYKLIGTFNNPIKSVAIGRNHCLILDEEGNLYGLGEGPISELGIIKTPNSNMPQEISTDIFEAKIQKIVAGDEHALILLENGDLFALGMNLLGQCTGYDMNYFFPFKINLQSHEAIIDVFAGYNHNLCISEHEEIYTWGDASEGKLGYVTEDVIKQNNPKCIVDINDKVINAVCLGQHMTVLCLSPNDSQSCI